MKLRTRLTERAHGLGAAIRQQWPVCAVLGAYAMCVFVIPIGTSAVPADEWIFVRSAEHLAEGRGLGVPQPAAMTLVFQSLWGHLFTLVLGPGMGALRASVVALVILSAIALATICVSLGLDRVRTALVTILYLFNPLALVMSWSFMTDAPFVALVVIGLALFVRATRTERPSYPWMAASGVALSAAFLVRQQALLVAAAFVLAFVVTSRRAWREVAAVASLCLGIPAATAAVYYAWLTSTQEVPWAQRDSMRALRTMPVSSIVELVCGVAFVAVALCGFFVAPAVLPGLVRSVRRGSWRLVTAVGAIGLAAVVAVLAVVWKVSRGRTFPYSSSWMTTRGLGTVDMPLDRPTLIDGPTSAVLTVLVLVAGVALALLALRRWSAPAGRDRHRVLLLITFGALFLGIVVTSAPFASVPSLDRYFLPLLPIAAVLAVAGVTWSRLSTGIALALSGLIGVAGVLSTRDWLVMEDAGWRAGERALELGYDVLEIDGGVGWDGYHVYDLARDAGLYRTELAPVPWMDLWDLPIETIALVSSAPPAGYCPIEEWSYRLVFGGTRTVRLAVRC